MRHFTLLLIAVSLCTSPSLSHAADRIVKLNYPGFTIWLDCGIGGAVRAEYEAVPDTGNAERAHSFFLDSNLPEGCLQQKTAATYRSPSGEPQYDRGHLVPAQHLDHDPDAIATSNVMTNILPQERSLNRTGAWRETERRIECWRDLEPLRVWIGVFWGTSKNDDYFEGSHGIPTPDGLVKIVYREQSGTAIAWFIPNQPIQADQLDSLIIPMRTAETLLGEPLVPGDVDRIHPASPADWAAADCDPG